MYRARHPRPGPPRPDTPAGERTRGPVIQGREGPDSTFADTLVETASDLEDAGVVTLVLEGLTAGVAQRVTEFVEKVRSGAFPGTEHVYEPVDDREYLPKDFHRVIPSGVR